MVGLDTTLRGDEMITIQQYLTQSEKCKRKDVIELKEMIIYWIKEKIPNDWFSKEYQASQVIRYNRLMEVMKQRGD